MGIEAFIFFASEFYQSMICNGRNFAYVKFFRSFLQKLSETNVFAV